MSYLKIENLYRRPDMLECYALEKVHGTSARVSCDRQGELTYFGGEVSRDRFAALFDGLDLEGRFASQFPGVKDEVTVYGEAFGASVQGMSCVYGTVLRFIVFDVRIDGVWLDVESASAAAIGLGLAFVPYERGPLTLDWVDSQRDRPSLVAVVPAVREGVVIRPVYEATDNSGRRVIAKHKRDEFRETASRREVSPERAAILSDAEAVAKEWVTRMRLNHVLQRCVYRDASDIGKVVRAMADDVRTESVGEVEWSREVERAISKEASRLLREISFPPASVPSGGSISFLERGPSC